MFLLCPSKLLCPSLFLLGCSVATAFGASTGFTTSTDFSTTCGASFIGSSVTFSTGFSSTFTGSSTAFGAGATTLISSALFSSCTGSTTFTGSSTAFSTDFSSAFTGCDFCATGFAGFFGACVPPGILELFGLLTTIILFFFLTGVSTDFSVFTSFASVVSVSFFSDAIGASADLPGAFIAFFMSSTCPSSNTLMWLFTSIPLFFITTRSSLLSTPSSFANSCTFIFAILIPPYY